MLPTIYSNVVEQNQRLELTARGYLVTQTQIVPSVAAPLHITGQYTFTNTDPNLFDFLDITTRTAAIPGGGPHEVTDGISFTIWGSGNLVMIDRTNNVQIGPSLGFSAVANHPYEFTVDDDGLNVSLSVQEVGGSVLGSISGTSAVTSATNHIAFYNREGTSDIGYLDNVVITTPEPGTLAILLPACALAFNGRQRRRQKQTRRQRAEC